MDNELITRKNERVVSFFKAIDRMLDEGYKGAFKS
jgi:hypothetical protein